MAGFEGIQWAQHQLRFLLGAEKPELVSLDDRVPAVSKSLHYALCLAFEGIRFCCRREGRGLAVTMVNWHCNLERFRAGIAFNLSATQQHLVPTVCVLEELLSGFLASPELRPFLTELADKGAQGYLRPFTVDEDRSIGVHFPGLPSIRAVVCRYDSYLGEPFRGVVVPSLVRAVACNGTGCLKLGVNYLISIKAVEAARRVDPEARSALFLDDQPQLPVADRLLTEWDSSCCLVASTDGTVLRIPDNPLILPSVTIRGLVALLRDQDISVREEPLCYGELQDLVARRALVAICSVGTAGILNRCASLTLVDAEGRTIARHQPLIDHPLYATLGNLKEQYWSVYRGRRAAPVGMEV